MHCASLGWFFLGQKLDLPAILGMALIVSCILPISLFSKSAAHR